CARKNSDYAMDYW
nr:immunoglobulin heavy chain junction region [Mus musculus]